MTPRLVIDLGLGAGAGFLALRASQHWTSDQALSIASSLTSIDGTMLGFVIAAMAILASINDRSLIQSMKRTGHLKDLLSDLFWTAGFYAVGLLIGIYALFSYGEFGIIATVVAVAFCVTASLRLLGAGHKFYKVIIRV